MTGPRVVTEQAWMAEGACRGMDPDLFFPTKGYKAADAKAICAECPVIEPCLTHALENREKFGVWGGTTEKERRVLLRPYEPDNHGTTTGYRDHYRDGTEPCDPCRAAHAAFARQNRVAS